MSVTRPPNAAAFGGLCVHGLWRMMNQREQDQAYLVEAVAMARRADGRTSPNPPAGAVVVKDGHVVGRGWTAPPGGPHAEVVALRGAGAAAQ
ncbi:MAG TPA: hypothetical protein VLA19_26440, partial [Herpetosiphonaceae bacterium]|nr:hypothetical protein [Herpetosiphonaceae bacterium]